MIRMIKRYKKFQNLILKLIRILRQFIFQCVILIRNSISIIIIIHLYIQYIVFLNKRTKMLIIRNYIFPMRIEQAAPRMVPRRIFIF